MTTSVVPCLTFAGHAEEAITFYVTLLPNSRVVNTFRVPGEGGPIPQGQLMNAEFILDGVRYRAFDGGEHFQFSDAFSFVVTCETQAEIDRLWTALTADGGREERCGWLTDRFGVSWQIVPAALGRMFADPEHGDVPRMTEAMLGMVKLDIAALERAYRRS